MPIDIVMVIFRFTLFGLLVYKVTQLIKSYAIPFLKGALDLEYKHQTELLEKEQLLVSTQRRLENQINHQKKTFTFLDKNALLWQTHLLKKKKANEQEAEQTLTRLNAKRKIQQEHLTLAKDSMAIIPITCEQAAAELVKKFSGKQGAQQLRSFITSLAAVKHKTS